MPTFEPIGVVHSPYRDKREAPRQGVANGARGSIELFAQTGFEHALADLEGFERIFVLFHFHQAEHFRPKIQPPRSSVKRGVFATRSPHRPNPIGLTIVKLISIEGLLLHVEDLDMIDETPVLDLKPYVAYADSFPRARAGWLDEEGDAVAQEQADGELAPRDPIAAYVVTFSDDANAALAWLSERGVAMREALQKELSLGGAPHPYRRIKKRDDAWEIAIKEFRASFQAKDGERTIAITRIFSGYSASDLATKKDAALDLHREFIATFGASARR